VTCNSNKSLDIIIDGKNAAKVLESEHYHGSEGGAKFEVVIATFSLFCTASCRTQCYI
jgi:hypothetical protein